MGYTAGMDAPSFSNLRIKGPCSAPSLRRRAHGLFACAHCWLLALLITGAIGLAAALALAAQPDDVRHYNLSSLGADGRAAPVFNGTLIAIGTGFFILAWLTYQALRELQRHGRLGTWRAYSLAAPLALVGLALIGAAAFHLDGPRGATIHILSSAAGLATILFLMLTPLGLLGALFGWVSRTAGVVISTLFALSSEHLLAGTAMEVAVLLLISAWLFYLQMRLRIVAVRVENSGSRFETGPLFRPRRSGV
jgi:hypothetical protein